MTRVVAPVRQSRYRSRSRITKDRQGYVLRYIAPFILLSATASLPAMAEERPLSVPLKIEAVAAPAHHPWTRDLDPAPEWSLASRLPLSESIDLRLGWYGFGEDADNVMLGCVPAASERGLDGICIRQDGPGVELTARGFSVAVEQQIRVGDVDLFGRVSFTELDVRMQADGWRRKIAVFGGGARWYPTDHDWGLQAVATRSLYRDTVLSAGLFISFK